MARRRDKDAPPAPMPSREALRDFIRKATGRVGKREIERAFRLGPEHRVALRGLLKDMAGEGVIAPAGHRRFSPPGRLPDAMIVQVTGTDPDGDAVARPVEWEGDGPPPMVLMHAEPRGQAALAPGQRVLARLRPIAHGKYEGRTLKRLTDAPGRVLGLFRAPDRLVPTDRRQKAEWLIAPADREGAEDGEIVLCIPAAQPQLRPEIRPRGRTPRPHGRRPLGQSDLHLHPRNPQRVLRRGRGGCRSRASHAFG